MKILSLMNINVETLSAEEIIERREEKIRSHFDRVWGDITSNFGDRLSNSFRTINWNIFAPPNEMLYDHGYLDLMIKAVEENNKALKTMVSSDKFYLDQINQAIKNDNKKKLENIRTLIVEGVNKHRETLFKQLKISKDTINSEFKKALEKNLYPKGPGYSVPGKKVPPISDIFKALDNYKKEYNRAFRSGEYTKKDVIALLKKVDKINNDEMKGLVGGALKSIHYLNYELTYTTMVGIVAKYYYYEQIVHRVASAGIGIGSLLFK